MIDLRNTGLAIRVAGGLGSIIERFQENRILFVRFGNSMRLLYYRMI
jgi:hypothetical protein